MPTRFSMLEIIYRLSYRLTTEGWSYCIYHEKYYWTLYISTNIFLYLLIIKLSYRPCWCPNGLKFGVTAHIYIQPKDTANNPIPHASISCRLPYNLMAGEKKMKHISVNNKTLKMDDNMGPERWRSIKNLLLNNTTNNTETNLTPTRCRPTADAAHVLAMDPVFPGICEVQSSIIQRQQQSKSK
jgi:hypothetical protein